MLVCGEEVKRTHSNLLLTLNQQGVYKIKEARLQVFWHNSLFIVLLCILLISCTNLEWRFVHSNLNWSVVWCLVLAEQPSARDAAAGDSVGTGGSGQQARTSRVPQLSIPGESGAQSSACWSQPCAQSHPAVPAGCQCHQHSRQPARSAEWLRASLPCALPSPPAPLLWVSSLLSNFYCTWSCVDVY